MLTKYCYSIYLSFYSFKIIDLYFTISYISNLITNNKYVCKIIYIVHGSSAFYCCCFKQFSLIDFEY